MLSGGEPGGSRRGDQRTPERSSGVEGHCLTIRPQLALGILSYAGCRPPEHEPDVRQLSASCNEISMGALRQRPSSCLPPCMVLAETSSRSPRRCGIKLVCRSCAHGLHNCHSSKAVVRLPRMQGGRIGTSLYCTSSTTCAAALGRPSIALAGAKAYHRVHTQSKYF